MASGHCHDKLTIWLTLPIGIISWPWVGSTGAVVAAISFLLGGLLLSPDLDVQSNASRRWGFFQWLWWPYRRLTPHRSLMSHSPLLGSVGRITYLTCLIIAFSVLLIPFEFNLLQRLWSVARIAWEQQRALVLVSIIGIEASSLLHLIQDGYLWPKYKKRHRLGRKRP